MRLLCRIGLHGWRQVWRWGWPRSPLNPNSAVSCALYSFVYGWQYQGERCRHCGERK